MAKAWSKFDEWLEAPIWRFQRLSGYKKNGVMSKMFDELRRGLNKQESFNMKVVKHYEQWFKDHKGIAEKWHDMVTINGVELSRGQAMSLYMMARREQAQGHIYNRTITEVTPQDKGYS